MKEQNIKLTIDDSVLKKLAHAFDEAAARLLSRTASPQTGGFSGIFDSSDKFVKTAVQKNNETNLEELTKKMLGDFEGMLSNTQKMLKNIGLIDSEVSKILQMIVQLVNSLSNAFDFGKSVFGFITNLLVPGGGSMLDFIGGGAGMANQFSPQSGGRIYPVTPSYSKVVYVVPRNSVIRGRDIYTSWEIEEQMNSSAGL